MLLYSWNVNGLRACLGKGYMEWFERCNADIVCLQETKMQEGQVEFDISGYKQFWNSAEKKGYSGTATITRINPVTVSYGMEIDEHDHEGRIIRTEFHDFQLINVYVPNSQRGLTRLDYRMKWEDDFCSWLLSLDAEKPVVVCGDFNVAHQEIDLKNPKSNRESAGFTDQERAKFTKLLCSGFTDSFRLQHPNITGAYSWWSYMYHARENNAGWRIDYFLVSNRIKDNIISAEIHSDIMGSDHCPISLKLEGIC